MVIFFLILKKNNVGCQIFLFQRNTASKTIKGKKKTSMKNENSRSG